MIHVVLKIKTPRKASCIYALLIIFLKDKIVDTLRGQMHRLNDINKFIQTWNQKSEKYVYDAITDYLPGKRTGVSCRNCDWVRSHRLTEDGPFPFLSNTKFFESKDAKSDIISFVTAEKQKIP